MGKTSKNSSKSFAINSLERIFGKWWLMLLEGICLIIIGIFTIFNSSLALTTLIWCIGLYLGIMGVFYIIAAIFYHQKLGTNMTYGIIHGIINLIICAIFVFAPGMVVTIFMILIGIWAIISGILLLATCGSSTGAAKIGKIILGLLLILFGILTFFNPFGPANVFTIILGIVLTIYGVFLALQSFSMKQDYAAIKKAKKGYDDYTVQ